MIWFVLYSMLVAYLKLFKSQSQVFFIFSIIFKISLFTCRRNKQTSKDVDKK